MDFAGGWDQADPHDASNLLLHTGFVIKYADCPIYWLSKLQTKIALSTVEAEYITLSSVLCKVIPLMTVMDKLNKVFPLLMTAPQFFCKVWVDNQSCIAMATSHGSHLERKILPSNIIILNNMLNLVRSRSAIFIQRGNKRTF